MEFYKQLISKEGPKYSKIKNLDIDKLLPHLLIHEEVLEPGRASSRRHSHSKKEEFIYLLEGELVFIEADSQNRLETGDSIAIPPKTDSEGHYMFNSSQTSCKYLSIATQFEGDKVRFFDN